MIKSYDTAYGKVSTWDAFTAVWQAVGYLQVSEVPGDKKVMDDLCRAGAFLTKLAEDG